MGLLRNGPLDTNILIRSIEHCFVFRTEKCESKVNAKTSEKKTLNLHGLQSAESAVALYINQLKMTEVSVETCLTISKVLSFSLNF